MAVEIDTYNRNQDDKSKAGEDQTNEYNIDSEGSLIQKGEIQKPGFYGDQSKSASFGSFSNAVGAAAGLIGIVDQVRQSLVKERKTTDQTYYLTTREYAEIQKLSILIASYGNVPIDVVEDFLIILCYVNVAEDMRTIADGVQIAELANPAILRKPMEILAIRSLQKIAFAASAVEGLVNLFRKYLPTAQNTPNQKGESIESLIQTMSSVISGFGSLGTGGATERLKNFNAEDALGHFMSELITGKRIPMTVIAKNPNLQSPSYTGKAMFGEAPTALTNIDITQVFNKKIAAFPKPSNGAGVTAFGFQNLKSFAGGGSVMQIASQVFFGNSNITAGTKKFRQLETIANVVKDITGALPTEFADVRRADTAIPLMSALSAAASGTDRSIFSADTYKQAWLMSNGISNQLQNSNPQFLEAVKNFL